MDGVILSLYKNPISVLKESINYFDNENENVIWMHYDYFKANYVENFSDFFFKSEPKSSKNIQSIQSIYLYSLKREDNELLFCNKEDEEKILYREKSNTANEEYSFFTVSSIKFVDVFINEEIKTKDDFFQAAVKIIKSNFETFRKKDASLDFSCNFYASLGSEDIVLIAASSSINTLLHLIEIMRLFTGVSCKMFQISSTNSFIVNNNKKKISVEEYDSDISISLTLNPSNYYDYLRYLEELKESFNSIEELVKAENKDYHTEIKIKLLIGKFDLRVYVPMVCISKVMDEMYNKDDGLLNPDNPYYQKCVYQSRTNWTYDCENTLQFIKEFEFLNKTTEKQTQISLKENKKNEVLKIIKEMNYRFDKLIKKELKIFLCTPAIERVVRMLFHDYSKNMVSTFCDSWYKEVTNQLKVFFEILIQMDDRSDSRIYKTLEKIINAIRHTYIHINQANQAYFEVSATNLRYTGSFNKVLKCYYNIIESILQIGYSFGRGQNTQQSMIVPIVNFEYTPKIYTDCFESYKKISKDEDKNTGEFNKIDKSEEIDEPDDKKLVIFSLPYDALSDIPRYIAYLCHEVFHYIAPIDRAERNIVFVELCLKYFSRQLMFFYEKKLLEKISEIDNGKGKEKIRKFINNNKDQIVESVLLDEAIDDFYQKLFYDFQKEKKISSDNFTQLYDQIRSYLNATKNDNISNIFEEMLKCFNNHSEKIIVNKNCFNSEDDYEDTKEVINELIAINKKEIQNSKLSFKYYEVLNPYNMGHLQALIDAQYHGIREAGCDYFMIQVLNLSFEKYVQIIFDLFYSTNEKFSGNSDLEIIEANDFIRFGVITTYFYEKNKMDEKIDLETFFDEKIVKVKYLKKHTNFESNILEKCIDQFEEGFIRELKRYKKVAGRKINNDVIIGEYHKKIIDLINFENSLPVEKNEIDKKSSKENNYLGSLKLKQLETFYKAYKECMFTNDKAKLFKINIKMMDIYYNNFIPEFNKVKREQNNIDVSINLHITENFSFDLKVDTISEYIDAVAIGVEKIQRDASTPIWYRGETNSNYNLLPSLFRKKHYKVAPLRSIEAYYNNFTHQSSAAIELSQSGHIMNSFDTAVCMQHYGMPTHLLDWSENAMVALYFALFPEQGEKSLEKINEDNLRSDKKVYLLNPERMNWVRNLIVKINDEISEVEDSLIKSKIREIISKDSEEKNYMLLNLSNNYYSRIGKSFDMEDIQNFYPYFNEHCETENKIKLWQKQKFENISEMDLRELIKRLRLSFPISTFSSLTNIRIRAQHGAFTAFDLLTPHDSGIEESDWINAYSWAAINKIHDLYKVFIKETEQPLFKPFLYEIIINRSAVKKMQKELENIGFTRMRIYPELGEFCSTITGLIEKHLKVK